MEFGLTIEKILVASKNGEVFLSGKDQDKFTNKDFKNICFLLDKIGDLSSKVNIYFFNIFILFFGKKLGSTINFRNNFKLEILWNKSSYLSSLWKKQVYWVHQSGIQTNIYLCWGWYTNRNKSILRFIFLYLWKI